MTADDWFEALTRWEAELRALRRILLGSGLAETVKWRQPCYTDDQGRNVAILAGMKDRAQLSFFKGALLDDPDGILQDNGPNTRSAKVARFTGVAAVEAAEAGIRALVASALDVARRGLKVEPPAEEPGAVEELEQALDSDPAFRAAFEGLTPGRRRAYQLHFGAAKRAATRAQRVERYRSRIMAGKGIHDCVCGHSKRMPNCDGSHKHYPTA